MSERYFRIIVGLWILAGLFLGSMQVTYALAAVLMVPTMLSKAELATAMPRSGGSYFFIERSLGPLVGAVAGLANWLSIALKSAFALVGIGALATVVFPDLEIWGIRAVALTACVFFAILNIINARH